MFVVNVMKLGIFLEINQKRHFLGNNSKTAFSSNAIKKRHFLQIQLKKGIFFESNKALQRV